MNKEELFEKEPISKLLIKMCVPASITILIMIIYNMADMFFIGQIGDPLQVAAISLTMPLSSILSAIGTLIGGGACTAIAISLGKKELDLVKKMTSFSFYLSLAIGFIFTLVIFIFSDNILRFIGTSDQTYEYTKMYMTTLFLGAPIILLCNVLANMIRATGPNAAKDAMVGNIIGTIVNIILDPIFILVLDFGVKGAAAATIIGNSIALIYYLRYLLKNNKEFFSIKTKDFSFKPEISTKILLLGLPTAIGIVLMSFSNILKNNAFASYGDIVVAASGIVGRITMIIGTLQIGITSGIQPAIAYNFGANNSKRVSNIIKYTAITTFAVGFTLTVLGRLFGTEIIRFFINDSEVITIGESLILGSLISGPIIGWFYISVNYLQSTERAKVATILSSLRQGVIYIPILFIAQKSFGLMGIVYSNAIADIISTIIGVAFCWYILQRSKKS